VQSPPAIRGSRRSQRHRPARRPSLPGRTGPQLERPPQTAADWPPRSAGALARGRRPIG